MPLEQAAALNFLLVIMKTISEDMLGILVTPQVKLIQ